MKNVEDLIREAKQSLRDLQGKVCRKCKKVKILVQSGYCEECYKITSDEREVRKKDSKIVDQDKGYVRIYHPVTGKLVLEHRYVMEELLGRPLKKGEVVLHRNLNNSDNDPGNLMLGFKSGTPFEHLRCENCDSRGTIIYDPPAEESPQ